MSYRDNKDKARRELWIGGEMFTYIPLERLKTLSTDRLERGSWLYDRWHAERKFGSFK